MLLKDNTNLNVIKQVIDQVVSRHEILRTSCINGKELIIEDYMSVPIKYYSIIDQPIVEQDKEIQRLIKASIDESFDFNQGPFIRILLIQKTQKEYILGVIAHHMIMDGWSISTFMNELLIHLKTYKSFKKVELPKPTQYSDYVKYMNEYYYTVEGKEAKEYWKSQFKQPMKPIYFKKCEVEGNDLNGMSSLTFSKDLTKQLKLFSQSQHVTLFMTLLSAYAIMIHKVTAIERLAIGVPISGQLKMEADDMIGNCVANLPIYIDITNNMTVEQVLEQVCKKMKLMQKYQFFSYTQVIEELDKEEQEYSIPSIQLAFNMDRAINQVNDDMYKTDSINLDEIVTKMSKYTLFLDIVEKANALTISFSYNKEFISDAMIVAWKEYYKEILTEILAMLKKEIGQVLGEQKIVIISQDEQSIDEVTFKGSNELNDATAEDIILQVMRYVLRREELTLESCLLDEGLDSIKAIQIASTLKKHNIQIAIEDLFKKEPIYKLTLVASKVVNEIGEYQNDNGIELIKNEKDIAKAQKLMEQNKDLEAIYPLTEQQTMILANNITKRNTGNDVTLLEYTIKGTLNVEHFKLAWEKVVERHSILRTGFMWRHVREPLQLVYKSFELPFYLLDWSEMSITQKEEEYKKYIISEKMSSFDINKPPLLKLILIKYGESEWKFLLKCQNSLFDGWSSNNILNELMAIYTAINNKKPIKLENTFRFMDYIKWLYKQNNESEKIFWEKEFEGFRAKEDNLSISINTENTKLQEVNLEFTEEEANDIRVFSSKHQLMEYTIMLQAWAILQGKLLDSKDIMIATGNAGRPYMLPDIAQAVGMFSNTGIVRITLDEEPSIYQLKELQAKNIRYKEYEYITYDKISQWCNIPLKVFQETVYTRGIVFLNFPTELVNKNYEENNLDVIEETEAGYVNVPLRLYIQAYKDFRMVLRYQAGYINEKIASKMLMDYKQIIVELIKGE